MEDKETRQGKVNPHNDRCGELKFSPVPVETLQKRTEAELAEDSTCQIHLGLDDTDSTEGMCTTYLATVIIEKLSKLGNISFTDYPNLVRLNPNIPWKTRGNGSVAIRLLAQDPDKVFVVARDLLIEYSESDKANSGLVFLKGKEIPQEIRDFSSKATWNLLSKRSALHLLREFGIPFVTLRNGQGVVGALAAVGYDLGNDYTYEVVGYRKKQRWGQKRVVEFESVKKMDSQTYPMTFNNIDMEKNRVIITPRGPDPVLFGIRGENPEILLQAMNLVKFGEPISTYMIFRSNQGTNSHLSHRLASNEMVAFRSGYCEGVLTSDPKVHPGAHVSFSLGLGDGYEITCFAYEPTGSLNKIARELSSGDLVEIGGGIRKASADFPRVLNVEYIKVKQLASKAVPIRAKCSTCSVSLTSMGKGQGLRCPKCRQIVRREKVREIIRPRSILPGLYLPSTRAHRHLTRPLQRYYFSHEENTKPEFLVPRWNSFGS